MKKLFNEWKIWQFIEAALFLGIGITTLVCAINNNYKVIGLVAGIVLILDGVIHTFVNLVIKNKSDIFSGEIIGVIELSLGIWLCIKPGELAENVVLITALAVLVAGAIYLIDAVIATIKKSQVIKYLIMQYVACAVAITIGIIALVFFPYKGIKPGEVDTVQVILVILGALLILAGICETIMTILVIVKAKKEEKKAIENTINKREEQRTENKNKKKNKKNAVDAEVVEPKTEE